MAGLTDMSMGEIKRLDDNTFNESMAQIEIEDINDSGRVGDTGHRKGNHISAALPKGNILDDLKADHEQYLKTKEKEAEDLLEQKRRQLNDSVNAFTEVDESDYDSEEDVNDGTG